MAGFLDDFFTPKMFPGKVFPVMKGKSMAELNPFGSTSIGDFITGSNTITTGNMAYVTDTHYAQQKMVPVNSDTFQIKIAGSSPAKKSKPKSQTALAWLDERVNGYREPLF